MATFQNFATLSYNGATTVSNTVTGEILETITAVKTALAGTYTPGDVITYVISLVNTGTAPVNGLTVTDDLGGYEFGTPAATVYPLAYRTGTLRYLVNGVLTATPTVTAGPPLTVTGVNIPAGGNATIVYETVATDFAPVDAATGSIVNTATLTGGGLSSPITAEATVTPTAGARLTVQKALSPAVVTENGQITYTFTIENRGEATTTTDTLTLTDTFDPILTNVTATYGNTAWTQGVNYTYDEATGVFTTLPGQIEVPGATSVQNPDGSYTITPGTVTITVTGTV